MSSSHLRITSEDDVTIVELLEAKLFKLDETLLNEISSDLLALVDDSPCPQLLIDFQHTQAICSTMLGILIRLKKRTVEKGGLVALCSLQPLCHKLLLACNLDRVFDIYPDRTTALNDLTPEHRPG